MSATQAWYDRKGLDGFQQELSLSAIRSYNLCFLSTVGRKANSGRKNSSPPRPEVSRSITQTLSGWMPVIGRLLPVFCITRGDLCEIRILF